MSESIIQNIRRLLPDRPLLHFTSVYDSEATNDVCFIIHNDYCRIVSPKVPRAANVLFGALLADDSVRVLYASQNSSTLKLFELTCDHTGQLLTLLNTESRHWQLWPILGNKVVRFAYNTTGAWNLNIDATLLEEVSL